MERLYWKTDKEKIEQFIKEIPSKYLLGRFRSTGKIPFRDLPGKIHAWDLKTTINWRGYTFSVSRKTLKKEMRVREERGEIQYTRLSIHTWNAKYKIVKSCKNSNK